MITTTVMILHILCFICVNAFRAVTLGLTADDLAKVDSFIEDLKEQKEKDDSVEHIKKIAEADVLKVQVSKKLKFSFVILHAYD